jgi:DNA gyrase inhibitor GyrI
MNEGSFYPALVRIQELPAFRVASSQAFGKSPEDLAWKGLLSWMDERGLDMEGSRFFGFNNPSPVPGSPQYGYEQWLALDDARKLEAAPGSGIEIKDFAGGLFAVYRHEGSPERLPQSWGGLLSWVESSAYRRSSRQWLEECLTPAVMRAKGAPRMEDFAFDLYMAVDR